MGPTCKVTGFPGKKVSKTTLSHVLREEALRRVEEREWFFCADPGCDVVYFTADGETLSKDALRVRVGVKETSPPRPLCYCFGYSFEDLERDASRSGTSLIPEAITEKCRQGLDRCEETNPQGSCCLGNVRKALKDAEARASHSSSGASAGKGASDCCSTRPRRKTP